MKDFLHPKVNIWGLVSAAGALGCLVTMTALAGKFWWVFDLTSHFRLQYAAALLLLAVMFGVARKYRPAIAFAGFACINFAFVLPYCFLGRAPVARSESALRVMLINVHTENRRYDDVKAFVRRSKADLVVLEEVNNEWLTKLAELQSNYPFVCQESREDDFGIALFSKFRLSDSKIVYVGGVEVPSVSAEIEFGGKRIRILGTHPLPPASAENTARRDQQLSAIPAFLGRGHGSVILLGDLNTTPWSHTFRKLVRDTGLSDSGRGAGVQATWPADLFPLRIAIDHCLHSQDLRVVSRTVGADVGSDHLPLIVDLTVK